MIIKDINYTNLTLLTFSFYSDFVGNKTTKLPILSIDEHSENVEEKKSSMVNRFIFKDG